MMNTTLSSKILDSKSPSATKSAPKNYSHYGPDSDVGSTRLIWLTDSLELPIDAGSKLSISDTLARWNPVYLEQNATDPGDVCTSSLSLHQSQHT